MGFAVLAAGWLAAALAGVVDQRGKPVDPWAIRATAHVLLFVRSDCPVTNRYAPEIQRLAAEFRGRSVEFWLVYADRGETAQSIERHTGEYKLPGTPIRDVRHVLVKRAEAAIAPQAAVFDARGALKYSGRIDDRFVAIGKARPAPTTHDLEAAIEAVLGGRAPEPARTKAVGCYLADLE